METLRTWFEDRSELNISLCPNCQWPMDECVCRDDGILGDLIALFTRLFRVDPIP